MEIRPRRHNQQIAQMLIPDKHIAPAVNLALQKNHALLARKNSVDRFDLLESISLQLGKRLGQRNLEQVNANIARNLGG
jgi:hypothetical protein